MNKENDLIEKEVEMFAKGFWFIVVFLIIFVFLLIIGVIILI